jgi:4-hydroxy-tetrahydrodipicolinate synthase
MEDSKSPPRVGGAITGLVTPFEDGALDRVGLMALVERQILGGVDGLVVCGTTGEGPVLTDDERARIIAASVEIAEGKVPVIAASGTNSTETTIEETRQAQVLGANAALVTVPYYSKPSQDGIVRHFQTVADSTEIPLIVHNLPSHTAVDLAPATIERLGSIPGIIGIADGSGDTCRITTWRPRLPEGVALFSTHDATAMAFILAGGQGAIGAASNVVPRLFSAMLHAAIAGNLSAALVLHERLQPLFRALCCESEPASVKHALHLLRDTSAEVRLPLVEVEAGTQSAIAEALAPIQAECGNGKAQVPAFRPDL